MLVAEHIRKSYGKKVILEDINITIRPGESVAIIGKNGCGKSTLLQILAGINKPDAGNLAYYGQTPLADKKVFQTMCGYVPQENPLLEELTVYDNLRLFGAGKAATNHELMQKFEIEDILHQQVSRLSGGMKRRVAIACSVHHLPAILFMDEPTTALDIYYKSTIHDWMDYYRKRNGILLITSHDEQEILECDRCFLMSGGTVRELSAEEKNEHSIRKLIIQS